ncbi:MAG: sulfatase-like hydrolase/transferase [Opitutales bacterium]
MNKCLLFLLTAIVVSAQDTRPNILFILMDDLGKEWISSYGATDIETPYMDQLATEGMRFENYYTMPQCTPTRLSFATGQYPFRHGWVNHWDVPRWGGGAHYDPANNPSIAKNLQKAGYKTAAAGKWQVSDFRVQPDAMNLHGYDEYCMWTGYEAGVKASAQRYWDPYIHTKDGSKTYEGQFGEDIFTDFFIDFMTEHKDEPMFMYYAMCLPHTPFVTTPDEPVIDEVMSAEMTQKEKKAATRLNKHKAMVRYADKMVKKLVDAIDALGLRDNTLIIVTTDNGTVGSITGTRNGVKVKGAKTRTHEAGTAVPFIISQPGTVPQGVVSNTAVNVVDMLPTFTELAGGKKDPEYTYDGYSMVDVFHGKSENGPRSFNLSMGGGNKAALTDNGVENQFTFRDRVVRDDRYKLIIDLERTPEKLFDLKKDPWEKTNMIDNPEMKEIIKRLFDSIKDQPAQDADPRYDPLGPQEWDVKITKQSQTWKKGAPREHPEN